MPADRLPGEPADLRVDQPVRAASKVDDETVAPRAARSVGGGARSFGAMLPLTVVALSGIAVAVVTFGDLRTPLRPAIALLFLLACPGLALVHLLRLSDRLAELTLAVALSIAFNTVAVGMLLFAGVTSSETVLAVLLSLTLAAVVLDIAVGGRVARGPDAP